MTWAPLTPEGATEQIPKAQRGEFKGYGEAQISPTTLIRFTEYLHKNMFLGIRDFGTFSSPLPESYLNSLAPSVLLTSAAPLGADLLLKLCVQ